MKSIISIIFIICPLTIIAQTYQEVVKPDTSIWYFAHRQLSGSFIDTLYAKEKNDCWTHLYYRGEFFNQALTYAGKLKASDNNDKIWYVPPEDNDSILIYDITLNQGDTFYFDYFNYTGKVDTTFLHNGRRIVQFDVKDNNWNEKFQFIEGVGPNITLVWTWNLVFLSPYVVCKFENGEHVFTNESRHFSGCTLNTTSLEDFNSKEGIRVSPNPFQDHLKIDMNDSKETFQLRLYDIRGKFLYNTQLSFPAIINTSHLDKGLYILHLMNNESLFTSKILKK